MKDEEGLPNRFTVSGPTANLLLSALLGGTLGFGSTAVYQKNNPSARALAYTSEDHRTWRADEFLPLREASFETSRHIDAHSNEIEWLRLELGECKAYRRDDDKRARIIQNQIENHELRLQLVEKKRDP